MTPCGRYHGMLVFLFVYLGSVGCAMQRGVLWGIPFSMIIPPLIHWPCFIYPRSLVRPFSLLFIFRTPSPNLLVCNSRMNEVIVGRRSPRGRSFNERQAVIFFGRKMMPPCRGPTDCTIPSRSLHLARNRSAGIGFTMTPKIAMTRPRNYGEFLQFMHFAVIIRLPVRRAARPRLRLS